jgi:hypothetical protein
MQQLVNEHANVLDGVIGLGPIDWLELRFRFSDAANPPTRVRSAG